MINNSANAIEQWIKWGKDLDSKNLHNEAISCFRVVTDMDVTSPEDIVLKGEAFALLGDYWSASALYESAFRSDPELAKAYNQMGVSLEEQAYLVEKSFGWNSAKPIYENALTYYNIAIGKDPNYLDAYNNKGIVLIYLQKYSEAFGCFDHVLDNDPDCPANCPDIYFNLSAACRYIPGRLGDAENYMRIAMESGLMNTP